ncbi:MAG: hypothetical protein SPG76_03295 [Candidatus Enterosoma sp.]|nr:hypothetical protein [Candidatus Enterosoma sp.]MDY5322717.1 hypothetical protein [Candidatus Enterosoma sp.]
MKNLNKSKIVGVAAVSLAAVSLIGVGFASWVISGISSPVSSDNVIVTVGDVTDNRVDLAIVSESCDTVVKFECDGTTGNPIQSSGENLQDLNFAIGYSLNPKDTKLVNLPVPVTVSITLGGTFIEWMNSNTGYVSLSCSTKGFTLGTYNEESKTMTCAMNSATTTKGSNTVNFSFAWGTKFKGTNPAALSSEEINSLGGIETVLQSLKNLKAANSKVISAVVSAA